MDEKDEIRLKAFEKGFSPKASAPIQDELYFEAIRRGFTSKMNKRKYDSPPKDDDDQIAKMSLILKAFKEISQLTADEIANKLPPKYQMSRTALNAYLYGTVKTPPTRDFLLAVFNVLGVPKDLLDVVMGVCGYRGHSVEKEIAKDLIIQICTKSNKKLSNSSIEKLANRIYSMAEMFIDEECKELLKGATNN